MNTEVDRDWRMPYKYFLSCMKYTLCDEYQLQGGSMVDQYMRKKEGLCGV